MKLVLHRRSKRSFESIFLFFFLGQALKFIQPPYCPELSFNLLIRPKDRFCGQRMTKSSNQKPLAWGPKQFMHWPFFFFLVSTNHVFFLGECARRLSGWLDHFSFYSDEPLVYFGLGWQWSKSTKMTIFLRFLLIAASAVGHLYLSPLFLLPPFYPYIYYWDFSFSSFLLCFGWLAGLMAARLSRVHPARSFSPYALCPFSLPFLMTILDARRTCFSCY